MSKRKVGILPLLIRFAVKQVIFARLVSVTHIVRKEVLRQQQQEQQQVIIA